MNCYVKFGYGWEYVQQSKISYLTNSLGATIFALDENNSPMAELISEGVELDYLVEHFGEQWEKFREDLEANYAIIYSNCKSKIVDSVDYGARMSMSSTFVRQPPKLTQLAIEVNRRCQLDCSFCGEKTAFECLACKSQQLTSTVDYKAAIAAIKHLSTFGIPMLLLQGGDPLLDFEITKKLVIFYKRLNQQGVVTVLTNGMSILELGNEQLDFLSRWTRIFLVVTSKNLDRLNEIINVLDSCNIEFDIVSRNVDLPEGWMENVTINNTVATADGLGQVIFTRQNIVKPYDLYNNTIKYDDSCYQGRVYMSMEGDVSICKGYEQRAYNVENYGWPEIMSELKKQWHNLDRKNSCGTCKLNRLCYSCESIKDLYHNREIADSICFSNII